MKYTEVLDQWYTMHIKKVAESTAYNYGNVINSIKKYFTNKEIGKISYEEIQNYIDILDLEGKATNTIINTCKILNMSFNYACKKKYIKENPCIDTIIPRKATREINPFTEEEILKLISVQSLIWVKQAIIIAYRTGLRKGEIFSLKWTDINLELGFIQVKRTQSYIGSKVILKEPKTKYSNRRVDIDKHLITLLFAMKQCSKSEFVMSYINSEMRIPWNIAATIKKTCKLAGLEPRSFHQLRHTHATILLLNNIHPKIVQERLGHSNISTTLNTYSHLVPGMQKEAVKVFENINDSK